MGRSLRFVSVVFVSMAAIAVCTAAFAQPGPGGPPPFGGGFGGPGMGMGMFMQSPYMLLGQEAVAKELNLTDDQKSKIGDINEKAQASMRDLFADMGDLSPEERQQKMTEIRDKMQAQRTETNKALEAVLLENQAKRLKEIFIQVRGEQALRDPAVQDALGLSEDQKKKIRSPLEVLSDDQKAAFDKMKGEKFDVSSLRFGPPGGRGPGGFGPGGPGGERRRPPAAKSEE